VLNYLSTFLGEDQIVGWSMSHRLQKELVTSALDQAICSRRPDRGLIFHSDRGSQYACNDLRKKLVDKEIRQSMSGKGNCYDNAVAESFFATLKTELMKGTVFETRKEAKTEVFDYIEVFEPLPKKWTVS
jgi:putative transposase